MTRLAVGVAAALSLLGTLACRERRQRVTTAGSQAREEIAVEPGRPVGRVALELWQLRDGVTLGEWFASRATERVELFRYDAEAPEVGEWCARTEARAELGGRRIVRHAYFYLPAPPAPAVLPAEGAGPELITQRCTLGLIWVSVAAADSADGAGLVDSLRAQLTRAYGRGEYGVDLGLFGSANWTRPARWRLGRTTIASFQAAAPPFRGSLPPSAASQVVAFAFLPASGISADTGVYATEDGGFEADTFPLRRAVELTGLDSARWAPLMNVLAGAEAWNAESRPIGPPLDPADLVGALRRWLAAAERLSPGRRAAALFVADQVLDRARCAHGLCEGPDSSRLEPLRALGAGFNFAELGGGWLYTHSWLREGARLDPDGPIGDAALLFQMERGFDTSGTCREGAEGFRRVIATGESYLARAGGDPKARVVHFGVAEAYRDIVALARGRSQHADSSRYVPEAPEARRKALEHYRAALAQADTSRLARAAWREAWRLIAGLPPHRLRFFCVYD